MNYELEPFGRIYKNREIQIWLQSGIYGFGHFLKETDFIKKDYSTSKTFRKNEIFMRTSRKKVTIKNAPSKIWW